MIGIVFGVLLGRLPASIPWKPFVTSSPVLSARAVAA
jgi:hypothetical protein